MIVYNRDLPFTLVGAHGSNSSLGSAVTLTPPTGGHAVILQAITQNVRVTLDGTTPTASVGFQIRAGDPPAVLDTPTGTSLKVIQETASAVLQYQWVSQNADFSQGYS